MMGHLQDCSSLHDPPGRASSLERPNPVSYPVSNNTMLRLKTAINRLAITCTRRTVKDHNIHLYSQEMQHKIIGLQ